MQSLRQCLQRASTSSQLSVSAATASQAVATTSGRGIKSTGANPASLAQRQALKDAGQAAAVPQVQTRQFAEAARLLPEEDPAARCYGDASTSGRSLWPSWVMPSSSMDLYMQSRENENDLKARLQNLITHLQLLPYSVRHSLRSSLRDLADERVPVFNGSWNAGPELVNVCEVDFVQLAPVKELLGPREDKEELMRKLMDGQREIRVERLDLQRGEWQYEDEMQKKLLRRQKGLEVEAKKEAKLAKMKVAQSAPRAGFAADLYPAQEFMHSMYHKVTEGFRLEQKQVFKGYKLDQRDIGNIKSRVLLDGFIPQLDPEKLAVIVLHKALGNIIKGENPNVGKVTREFKPEIWDIGRCKFLPLALDIGQAVRDEMAHHRLAEELKCRRAAMRGIPRALQIAKEVGKSVAQPGERLQDEVAELQAEGLGPDAVITRAQVNEWLWHRNKSEILERVLTDAQFEQVMKDWDNHTKVAKMLSTRQRKLMQKARIVYEDFERWPEIKLIQVGAFMLDVLRQHATLENGEPAFFHECVATSPTRLQGRFACHDDVIKLISPEQIAEHVIPSWLPMLVPPKPWQPGRDGPYYMSSYVGFVRRSWPSRAFNERLRQLDSEGALGQALILRPGDERVLHGMQAAVLPSDADVVGHVQKKNREIHSLRCDFELKLRVAKRFLHDDMYHPHNMDFRGRVYPIHPHLNHMGSDVNRALLKFAESKPLGEDGLFWLHMQLANSYGNGVEKLPFEERHAFVTSRLHEICASADDPYCHRWWREADKPWQCLAACMEVAAANRSPDPSAYLCSLPIQMDGSCNGLQHYAALGRDLEGGHAVNLRPAERPQDVYSGIAALVMERVKAAAAEGVPGALLLKDQVDRKLVKQSVMTSVYGVTYVGARLQIQSRLRERGWNAKDHNTYTAACFGASVVMDAMSEMFTSARAIMDWLAQSAKLIGGAGQPVEWTTPLGLPCSQPYREPVRKMVTTAVCKVSLNRNLDDAPIAKKRQSTAFPPNYIHSLDSSHMMMTATRCKAEGLTFAGVHDSFWTHAASVPEMNTILREAFVDLHSQDLLGDLRKQFQAAHPDIDFPPVPEVGQLELQEVLNAPYFFS